MRKISEYRTFMMGIAILWIMLFHTTGIFEVSLPIRIFQKSGNMGVDIFFFVSSYGLYYSMKKNQSIKDWYIRRFKRIYPSFVVVTLILFLFSSWTIRDLVLEDTFIGFFLPHTQYKVIYWFIPACFLFYLIFPLLYKYVNILNKLFFLITILSLYVGYFVNNILTISGYPDYLVFFLNRIPVFILGLIYAENEGKVITSFNTIKLSIILFFSTVFFVCMIFNNVGLVSFITFYGSNNVYLMASIPIICALCNKFTQYFKILTLIICYCGTYSLEIYLIHVCFQRIGFDLNAPFEFQNYVNIATLTFSIPSAWLLNMSVSYLKKL